MTDSTSQQPSARIIIGDNRDTLRTLPAGSVQTCVTSPPYWGLRDYGEDDQIGLEQTPDEYVEELCKVFDEVHRVLTDDGTLWLNLGDTYVGGKGASGQGAPEYQAQRHAKGESINQHYHQLGGKGKTKATDNMAVMRSVGLKAKDLVGIPWRVAFALQARGWYLRSEIIWHKPNPMPESVTDRPTKSHEQIFLFAKSKHYYYDSEAIKEPVANSTIQRLDQELANQIGSDRANGGAKTNGTMKAVGSSELRNKRDVWTVTTRPFKGAHFAVYPPALVEPCVLAGSRTGDTVLDPFSGSGTTGVVALQHGRDYIGLELNPEYADISERRISDSIGMMGTIQIIKPFANAADETTDRSAEQTEDTADTL